jgi:WD40 repeat protein
VGATEFVGFGPDGRTLAAGGTRAGASDSRVRVWNVADRARPVALGAPLPHRYGGHLLALAPDGDTLVVAGDDGGVALWRLTARGAPRLRATLPHGDKPRSVVFTPNGHLAISGADDGLLRVWTVTGPARSHPLGQTPVSDQVRTMALRPDGRLLATGGGDVTGVTRLWDVSSHTRLGVLGQGAV